MTVRQYLHVKCFGNYKVALRPQIYCSCAPVRQFLLVFVFFLHIISLDSSAENPVLSIENLSPIKITNSERNACASAVLLGDKVITNYHVASSVCPKSPCRNVKLFDAENRQIDPNSYSLQPIKSAAAYDLSVFEIVFKQGASSPNAFPTAAQILKNKNTEELTSFSFPGCSTLKVVSGSKTADLGALYFRTSLELKHGSSGAAVFDRSGNLNGIVSEAESIYSSLFSIFSGSNFSASRVVPLDRVIELIEKGEGELFELQIKNLFDFYKRNVVTSRGIARLEEGARFLSKLKQLVLSDLNKTKTSALLSLALYNYPFPLFADQRLDLVGVEPTAVELALAASIEQNGLNATLTAALSEVDIKEIIDNLSSKSELNATSVSDLIGRIKNTSYSGASQHLISLIIQPAIILIVLFSIWLLLVGRRLSSPATSLAIRLIGIVKVTFLLLFTTLILVYLSLPQ